MTVTTQEPGFAGLDALGSVDALCLFIHEDERPLRGTAGLVDWRMCGALSRLLLEGFFAGRVGEQLLLPGAGRVSPPRVFAIGAGPRKELTPRRLSQLLESAAQTLGRARMKSVAFEVLGAGALSDEQRARALEEDFLPRFKAEHVAVLAERGLRSLIDAR